MRATIPGTRTVTPPQPVNPPTADGEPALHLHFETGGSQDAAAGASPPDTSSAELRGTTDDVPAGTAAAVAYWRHRDPDLHPADIAARIGKSERTVRRHWSPLATNGTLHANGWPIDSLRR
ncbi:hypothetical protein ABGB16_31365 [Micromonospora sp. B11E3]|uniref:hypothetical protein n=1 Tax=Micromonospora sp. B11E3 TaxID=3153562 RepID=UPI00325F3BD4